MCVVDAGGPTGFPLSLLERSIMKNPALALLLFVLLCVCALPCAAQRTKEVKTKPAATAPPTPNAPAPAVDAQAKSASEQAGTLQGKVVDLGWGDSLTVADAQNKQHRVRLLGIDAPEKEQAFGPAARQKLSALVFGKAVTVKYEKMDRSGRPLGKVVFGALDINLEMLKAGLAWYYPNDRDLPESDRPLYSGAERDARAARRGLWKDEAPVSPWEFRQARRQRTPAPTQPGMETAMSDPAQVTAADPDSEKNPDGVAEKGGATVSEKGGSAVSDTPARVSDPSAEQAEPSSGFPKSPKLTVTGDSSTRTYYKAGCPDLERVQPQNRVAFGSVEEAEKAGFKRTPNCP